LNTDKMGRAHSMHKRNDKFIRNFGPKTLKRRKHLGDLDVGGRIVLRWMGVRAFD
jgi:hypothetical protein